jgi:hypothetical protein
LLTGDAALAKVAAMRKINMITAAGIATFLSLAACSNEPELVDTNPDPMQDELAKAAPVEVPPMIQASRTYRCKDNSLVYIDFYTNNTAQYRTEKGGPATTLTAPAPDQAYTAEGHSVSANAQQIQLTAPGKGSLSCKT